MAFESVRGYVQLASGLGELTKAKALEAAQGLLSLPGADEVTKRAVQASSLAEELLTAARSNRDQLVTLVRSEVETALRRADVARVADVEAARAAVSALTREVADLRAAVASGGTALVATAGRQAAAALPGRSGAVTTAHRAAAPSVEPAHTTTAPAEGSTPRKAPAKKASASKSTATKASAKKTTAKKTTAKKTTAKRTTATKRSAAAKAGPRSATPAAGGGEDTP